MRLIDADALVNSLINACNNDHTKMFPVWIEKQIDAQQDAVVLCKDCKYWTVGDFGAFCPYHYEAKPDWYCADGERKE